MTDLILTPNLDNADDVYAAILSEHDGLSPKDSAALNARLILILANHIGDPKIIRQALNAAKASDG
jgi:hypothetical protein